MKARTCGALDASMAISRGMHWSKCLAVLLAAMPTQTQTWAKLVGVVTDPQGAVAPAAAVTLTSPSTAAVRNTETNDAGTYGFSAVPSGRYDLRVEKRGFQPLVRRNVELELQLDAQLDFQLELSWLEESATV